MGSSAWLADRCWKVQIQDALCHLLYQLQIACMALVVECLLIHSNLLRLMQMTSLSPSHTVAKSREVQQYTGILPYDI